MLVLMPLYHTRANQTEFTVIYSQKHVSKSGTNVSTISDSSPENTWFSTIFCRKSFFSTSRNGRNSFYNHALSNHAFVDIRTIRRGNLIDSFTRRSFRFRYLFPRR